MEELGVDMSDKNNYYPKKLEKSMLNGPYQIFTMGCDVMPDFDIKINGDLNLDDPAGKGIVELRKIRDELKGKIIKLVSGLE